MNQGLQLKYQKLQDYIKNIRSVAVAFSGGVDSTLLLYAAKEAIGDRAIAVTVSSGSFPEREQMAACELAEKLHVRQLVVNVDEMAIEGFCANPENRCYLCKKEMFGRMLSLAREQGIDTVVEGSNTDDEDDYRPGMVAIRELGIKSPLRHAGLSKEEIRSLSREFGIPTWHKQSFACLATRFVYGEAITREKLQMVDKAEQLLIDMGFSQVRVRIHGDMARIEINPQEFEKLLRTDIRHKIYKSLKSFGFSYVTLDLSGYRTGSMNEVLQKQIKPHQEHC